MGHTFASDTTFWRIPARCSMAKEGGRRKVEEIFNIKLEHIQKISCFLHGKESLRIILSMIVMITDLPELNISDYEAAMRKINSMK